MSATLHRRSITTLASTLVSALAAACVLALPALARDIQVGAIKISTPWTRVTPPSSKVAGGFMTITNTGATPDRLIGGTAVVSKHFEVHEMAMDGGVMKMREVAGGLEIKPGETVTLKPGGYHVMFIDMTAAPVLGQPVKGTLVFEKAGTVEIEYSVEPFGTRVPGDGGQAMPGKPAGMDHGGGGHVGGPAATHGK